MAAVGSHTVGVGSLMTGVGSLAAAVGSLGFVSGGSACGLGRGRLAGESRKSLMGRRFGNAEAGTGTRQRWVRLVEKRNVEISKRRKRRGVREGTEPKRLRPIEGGAAEVQDLRVGSL